MLYFVGINKREILGFIILVISFVYFIFFIYIPQNENYHWLFPLGWDTPNYIFTSLRIEYEGYFQVVSDLDPHGSHLILLTFKCIFGNYKMCWHIASLSALFVSMLGIAKLYKESFPDELFWGYVAGALLPYFSTTYYMFGGLFRQLLFFSLYPFVLLISIKFLKNPSFRKLLYISGMIFVEWWIWPWGILPCFIILFSFILLTFGTYIFYKNIYILTMGIILYSIWYMSYLEKVYTLLGVPAQLLPRRVTRGIPFTFGEYLSKVANGSLVIFSIIIISFLIEIVEILRKIEITSVKNNGKVIIVAKIKKIKSNYITKVFLLIMMISTLIFTSPYFPFDEAARRMTPFLLQPIWIAHFIGFIFKKLRKKYLRASIIMAILMLVSSQLNPYSDIAVQQRDVWWRIWYYGDIKLFLTSLEEAFNEYYYVNKYPILIIVPCNYTPKPEITTCLYIKSFFRYAILIYAKNYSDLVMKISSGYNMTYIHPICSIDFEKFIKYDKMILYIKPFFAPDSTSVCYSKFIKDVYCVEELPP